MNAEPGSKGLFWTIGAGAAFRSRKQRNGPLPVKQRKVHYLTASKEANKASLAEWMAEGGTLSGWARAKGFHPESAGRLWRSIRADLGSQAQ